MNKFDRFFNTMGNIEQVLLTGVGDRSAWMAGFSTLGMITGIVGGAIAAGVGVGFGAVALGAGTALAVGCGVVGTVATYLIPPTRMICAGAGVLLGVPSGWVAYTATHPVETARLVKGAWRYSPGVMSGNDIDVVMGIFDPADYGNGRLRNAFNMNSSKPLSIPYNRPQSRITEFLSNSGF